MELPDGLTGYSSLHTTGVAPAVQADGAVAVDAGQASRHQDSVARAKRHRPTDLKGAGIVALDVAELDQGDDRFTGIVTNPYDVDVERPLGVNVACLDENGTIVEVVGGHADRDTIEAGGEATFTIDLYGEELVCEGSLAGASGYTQM